MNEIYFFTGAIHSGKTTRLSQMCRNRDDVYGILSPVVDGRRMFVDIKTKESFAMEADKNEVEILSVGKYRFSKKAFQKANEILLTATSQKKGWLIVDEVGPMELRGEGFSETVKNIFGNPGMKLKLLLVVRDTILPDLIREFDLEEGDYRIFDDDIIQFS